MFSLGLKLTTQELHALLTDTARCLQLNSNTVYPETASDSTA